MATNVPAHLEPSVLGTKEYWDQFYSADLSTPPSPTASLDGWFSDVNAASKILDYLTSPSLNLDLQKTSFLDLGTGNGEMLFLLREEGEVEGRMLGVDYSAPSVELARKVATAKSMEGIEFEHWDIMHGVPYKAWDEAFDIILDKGTFDAISLCDEKDARGRRLCEGYRERVEKLVRAGGLVLVTSCNWTEPELKTWFEGDRSSLKTVGRVSYPSFAFSGETGQSVATLCFRKDG